MVTGDKVRVFLSGGAGVIGTSLVNQLLEKGVTLFVGDLKPCPAAWTEKLSYREGDLNSISPKELHDFRPDYFFHLAATFERSMESYGFWEENYHHNVSLSHHLMSCLKDCPTLKKVIFASSYLVYDPDLYLFKEPQNNLVNLTEESSLKPRNLCGMAKLYHEQELDFIHDFRQGALQTISARIFRSFGKDSRDIISRWIRALLKNEPISVYCRDGSFDFIYAEDVAEGLFRLAETDFQGSVNLGNGHARKIHEVVQILKTHFPKMVSKEEESDIPFEASQASLDLLKKVTGWQPKHQLEDAIAHIIAHEKTAKKG